MFYSREKLSGRTLPGAPIPEARKRQHYARPGQESFGEPSHKLGPLSVESFGRLGVEGSKLIDQLEASVVEGGGGGGVGVLERVGSFSLFRENE